MRQQRRHVRTEPTRSIELNGASFERAFQRVAQAESRNGFLNDDQLRSIVDEATSGAEALEGVAESFR